MIDKAYEWAFSIVAKKPLASPPLTAEIPSIIQSFIFMGKPGKKNSVHISRDVGKLLEKQPHRATFLNWLVGDSGAGYSIVSNKFLLTNIQIVPKHKTMRINCNSGMIETNFVGDLEGYGTA